MAPTPSMKWKMTTAYRGGTKAWSFTTHFAGGIPANHAAWEAFWTDQYDDVLAMFPSWVEVVGVNGYTADGTPAVFTDVAAGPGTLTATGGEPQSAYVACLASWTTDARNSRGGPIYLRNFLHGAVTTSGDLDQVLAAQHTAINHWASKFGATGAGYTDGANTYHRAGPNGVVGQVGTCNSFVSHRVLARRG